MGLFISVSAMHLMFNQTAYAASTVVKWSWEDNSATDKTFSFTNESTTQISAKMTLEGQSATDTFTVPRYLYTYRDGSKGPQLNLDPLRGYFTITQSGDNYVLKPTVTNPSITATYSFSWVANLVQTRSGTKPNLTLTYNVGSGNKTASLGATINTNVTSIQTSKDDRGIAASNGQNTKWSSFLTNYGLSQSAFENDMKANANVSNSSVICYEEFTITTSVMGSQPYNLSLTESPDGGSVVGVIYDSPSGGYAKAAYSGGKYQIPGPFNYDTNRAPSAYVLVRYVKPRSSSVELANTATMTATGVDTNVSRSASATVKHDFVDLDFRYNGVIYGIEKWYGTADGVGGINYMRAGGKQTFRYIVKNYSFTSKYLMTDSCTTYSKDAFDRYMAASVKPRYRTELIDDVVLLQDPRNNTYLTLKQGDYRFLHGAIKMTSHRSIDGKWDTYSNSPHFVEDPHDGLFSVYIMKGNGTSWEVLPDYSKMPYEGKDIPFTLPDDVCRVKVVYEEDELGETNYDVELYLQIDGSGPTFQANKAIFNGNYSTVNLINSACLQGYQNNNASISMSAHGNGKDSWQNPCDQTCYDSLMRPYLVAEDTKIYGHGKVGIVTLPYNNGQIPTWGTASQYSQRVATPTVLSDNAIQAGMAKWHDDISSIDYSGPVDGIVKYNLVAGYGIGHTEDSSNKTEAITSGVLPASKQAVFYDLLPKGMEFVRTETLSGSERIQTAGNGNYSWSIIQSAHSYKFPSSASELTQLYNLKPYYNTSVETIDNYNNTGRQFVKITVNYRAYPIDTTFYGGNRNYLDMNMFSCRLVARLKDVDAGFSQSYGYTNLAAAQFIDEKTGKPISISNPAVHADNGSYHSAWATDFRDLDKDGNTSAQNVVSSQAYNKGIVPTNTASIVKKVKSDTESEWVDDVTVDQGAGYSYRLSYTLHTGSATNVVVSDNLETAYGSNGHWQGTFDYIDVSEAKAWLGSSADIKVYYNTSAVSGNVDLSSLSSGGWRQATLNGAGRWSAGGISVKAIAVSFGNFTFQAADNRTAKDNAMFYVHMKAPTGADNAAGKGWKAYNDAKYSNVQNSSTLRNSSNVVTVRLVRPSVAYIQVHKVSSQDSKASTEGAVYTVYSAVEELDTMLVEFFGNQMWTTDSHGINPIGTLTIGPDGYSNVLAIDLTALSGDYKYVYIAETGVPIHSGNTWGWELEDIRQCGNGEKKGLYFTKANSIRLSPDFTKDEPYVYESDDCQKYNYGMFRVYKQAKPMTGNTLHGNYSPEGAIYGIYWDNACTDEIGRVTIGADGHSEWIPIPMVETIGGIDIYYNERAVYVKELSGPMSNEDCQWHLNPEVYPYTVHISNLTGYISEYSTAYINDEYEVVGFQFNECEAYDSVTEYTTIQMEKAAPNGFSPRGAEFTVYSSFTRVASGVDGTLIKLVNGETVREEVKGTFGDAVGTLKIGANGKSNVLTVNPDAVSTDKVYVMETKPPVDADLSYRWVMTTAIWEVDLNSANWTLSCSNAVQALYNDIRVKKSVEPAGSSPLAGTYLPTGAVYAIYEDEACTREIQRVTIGADGYSDIARISWDESQDSKTVYMKEVKAPPVPAGSDIKWGLDTTKYEITLHGDFLTTETTPTVYEIPSTNRVTELAHVKIHKNAPSGRNPEGAVYTAYKDSNCTNAVGTFTIKADGDSDVLAFDPVALGTSKIYIKETGLPDKDTSADFVWQLDTRTYTVNLDPSQTLSAPYVVNSTDTVRTTYGYVRVHKLVKSAVDGVALLGTYSPAGAVYGIYSDAACRTEIGRATIGADGYSPKAKVRWDGTKSGMKVYVKEISAPPPAEGAIGEWNIDGTVYSTTLNCTGYVADANAPVGTVDSTNTVSEATYVKIHKSGPSGRNPQGAVYTAYKTNNNGTLNGAIGTFTIGANGDSNVVSFNRSLVGGSTFYIKETGLPNKDTSADFVWELDPKIYTVTLDPSRTADNPIVIGSTDTVRTLYNYVQVHKLVGADNDSGLTNSYSPAGAIYGVYGNSDCTGLITQLVIGENGYSDKFKISWASGLTGKTVYIKEISAPLAGSTSHSWNVDPKIYTVELSCDSYIPDDANIPVVATTSTDTVTEYTYVKIHKNAPSGRNPQGAVYTAYKKNANGVLSEPAGTFTIKSDGYSNVIRFNISNAGVTKLYVKETGLPNVDVSSDFTWLPDDSVYTINLKFVCTEDRPVVIDSTDTARTLYGYVQVHKDVVSDTGNPLIGYYSPEGAVYGVYSDAACRNIISRLTVANDGYSNRCKISWSASEKGKTVYVKEISAPENTSTAYRWNIDTEVHPVALSCNEYIKDDVNVGVRTAESTNTVTEYAHIRVNKNSPEKRNPQGAVYKAYKNNNNGVLSGEVGTFTVGADGKSNIIRLNATGLGVKRIFVKETGLPTRDISSDFTWLIDGNIYTIELNFTSEESKPYEVGSKDNCRTLYGYVQVHKAVASASDSSLNESYSPAGAVYGVYSDSACGNELTRLTIGADGYSGKYKVTWDSNATGKTVYVKEISAPASTSNKYEWRLDETVYPVNVSCNAYIPNDSDVPVNIASSKDTVQEYTFCTIRKETDRFKGYLEMVEGNPCYSLEGAEFKIETAYPTRQAVGTYVTGADGLTEPIRLVPGTYYVTETKAPRGYRLPAEATRQFTVAYGSGSDAPYCVAFEDIPVTDPIQIWIDKNWAS